MHESAACWVYAVVPDETPDTPAELTGVAGAPIRLVRGDGLAAAVSSVPRSEVAEQELASRLQDPEWLERAVRAHDQVVGALFGYAPTVPFRLATVYHSDARVGELLRQQAAALQAGLRTVTGRAEWGVQAFVAPAPPGQDGSEPEPPHPDTGRPGTAYLLRRRQQRERQERVRADARAAAQRLDTVLAGMAVAVHRGPPAARSPGGPAEPMVLNNAYLVNRDRAEEFTGGLHQQAAHLPQLRLRLTGPWPAYSFVDVAGVRS